MSESRGHFIGGQWVSSGGDTFVSHDPATGEPCWIGRAATGDEIHQAVGAARLAQPAWAAMALSERTAVLDRFRAQLELRRDELAELISIETGKPRWESLTEVGAMINKIPLTLQAQQDRCSGESVDLSGVSGATQYRPLGVLCVFGPFNFPGHVANGHIAPALLSGNTVVFKPSELTPLVAQHTVELWEAAGCPPGVINLVQGGRDTGSALAHHPDHDGILFTGSYRTAVALHHAMADHPHKMLALELGGNNPLIVHDVANTAAAAYHAVHSCFITAGQRCTCARRVIVPRGQPGDLFVAAFVDLARRVQVGRCDEQPEPFMGPVISEAAARRIMHTQNEWLHGGGKALLRMTRRDERSAFVTPGIIDVTDMRERSDEECFGPLAQVIRVDDFDAAITEANHTRYGLVAALFSDDAAAFDTFAARIRSGLINWNRPTTGASSRLPFGGVGTSGNHRPSGYFAVDYCVDPIASLTTPTLKMPDKLSPGISG